MFDFEKLTVYQKAKEYNKAITKFLEGKQLDKVTDNQIRRASFSIMLNIAEGTGRITRPDKRNFFVISRGSAFECVAILDYLLDNGKIQKDQFKAFYRMLEEISKMLYKMIQGLS